MTAVFDRYKFPGKRSFAMRAFNDRETEINEHFWSFKVVSEYSGYMARKKKAENESAPTAELFKAKGPDARRIPPTVLDWLSAQRELENWLRQSAIVSAASYLEAYLRQAVRSALMSDPMARYGSPRSVDGVILLKRGIEIPCEADVECLTKGDWNSRSAAFARLFGKAPDGLSNNLAALEGIRRLRNDFAHGFGRDLRIPPPSELDSRPTNRLSQERFIEYVGVVSRVANSIDRYLLSHYIGSFEMLHFYHEHRAQPRKPEDARYEPVRALQRCFSRDAGVTVSENFCQDLMVFYDSC
jgi:hypothetical protein